MHAWWLSECPSGKVIYTTNAIESVSMSLRMISKSWGCFPSDEAFQNPPLSSTRPRARTAREDARTGRRQGAFMLTSMLPCDKRINP
jgi:transposase-like protein